MSSSIILAGFGVSGLGVGECILPCLGVNSSSSFLEPYHLLFTPWHQLFPQHKSSYSVFLLRTMPPVSLRWSSEVCSMGCTVPMSCLSLNLQPHLLTPSPAHTLPPVPHVTGVCFCLKALHLPTAWNRKLFPQLWMCLPPSDSSRRSSWVTSFAWHPDSSPPLLILHHFTQIEWYFRLTM